MPCFQPTHTPHFLHYAATSPLVHWIIPSYALFGGVSWGLCGHSRVCGGRVTDSQHVLHHSVLGGLGWEWLGAVKMSRQESFVFKSASQGHGDKHCVSHSYSGIHTHTRTHTHILWKSTALWAPSIILSEYEVIPEPSDWFAKFWLHNTTIIFREGSCWWCKSEENSDGGCYVISRGVNIWVTANQPISICIFYQQV